MAKDITFNTVIEDRIYKATWLLSNPERVRMNIDVIFHDKPYGFRIRIPAKKILYFITVSGK
jgi:hypothetical protein